VNKLGGTPYGLGAADGMTADVVGVDLTEANGSVFTLSTSSSNTVGRLWKIKDATAGWLNPPIRWDVPAGVTTSTWDPTPCYSLTYDGTDLIITGGGISQRDSLIFFAVSASQPELPRRLGSGPGVYKPAGIAADANYFYVMGRSTAATNGGSLWRFDRRNLATAPLRILDTPVHSSLHNAVRLNSLTSPSYLYVRLSMLPGSPIHVVLNPAAPSPRDLGPLALPGGAGANPDFGMTYDRSTGTLYYVETATAPAGVIWQVQ
jgi:hypothetical protein